MSFELTKYRAASHDRLAVGGSYTDTWLEVEGATSTSSNTAGFVKWVPNNKNPSMVFGVSTTALASSGYLSYTLNTSSGANGFKLLKFNYYSDANTYNGGNSSPGINLNSISDTLTADELADELSIIHNDDNAWVYAIFGIGSTKSSASLYTIMQEKCRSWRWTQTRQSSTTATNHTYAAIGTNVNQLGFLSENLAGPLSNHTAAYSSTVIEHSSTTMGHTGYGQELSSGLGSGSAYLNMAAAGVTNTVDIDVPWQNADKYGVNINEYVRATFETRVGAGTADYAGYAKVSLKEVSLATGTVGTYSDNNALGYQSTDGWHKQEILLKKTTSSSKLVIEVKAYGGSGTGKGYDTVDVKNLQVFKAGNSPDTQRDANIHKFHVNGLNVSESPGPFNIGDPDTFVDFWNSDRNLAGNTQLYGLRTTNTSTSTVQNFYRPINYQSRNGNSEFYGEQGRYNYIKWFNTMFRGTSHQNDTQTYGYTYEVYNATVNGTYDTFLGPTTAITVDPKKLYMAGIWVKVRRSTGTNTGLAPNRISLIGDVLDSNNASMDTYGIGTSTITKGQNYLTSIYEDNFAHQAFNSTNGSGNRNEWKLISGFFLPSWMSSSDRTDWKNDYWGTWAGHFEHGDGSNPDVNMSGITGYGINPATAGYVCGMPSGTAKIRPTIRVEQYQSTDLWAEFMYPFVVEIDPMNITDKGNIYFWDFSEV